MHAEMILILLLVLVVSQIGLVQWKKRRPYSYHLCTLIGGLQPGAGRGGDKLRCAGMWIIPAGLSIRNHWWRFPLVWLGFSAVTGIVTRKSLEKPIQGTTPRLVYKWFLLIYKISYVVGIFGYFTMMATFLGFNLIFGVKPSTWMDLGLLSMFYALYYGVMARDFAEICTEKMAANIGYYKSEGIPERHLESDTCAGGNSNITMRNLYQLILGMC